MRQEGGGSCAFLPAVGPALLRITLPLPRNRTDVQMKSKSAACHACLQGGRENGLATLIVKGDVE